MVKKKVEVENKIAQNENTQSIIKVLAVIAIFVVIFFASYWIFGMVGKVNYQGMVFFKERYGDIILYKHTYHFPDGDGSIINYNFYVRTDPSKNNIPKEGEIIMPARGGKVFLSIDSAGLENCNQSTIAIAGLASFLVNNQFKVVSGLANKEEALAQNVSFIPCETNIEGITIGIRAGEDTLIRKKNNCHIIEVANCEMIPALEKFEVEALVDARARAS